MKQTKKENKYTMQVYGKMQFCMNLIEKRFFLDKGKEKLPKVVMAINNRCNSCVVAYIQYGALYDKSSKEKIQYFAINPAFLNRSVPEILSTICHEICHIYENEYIHIARGGYHDKIWAGLMQDCGLDPIYLNASKTAVSHKIIEGGDFEKFSTDFVEKYGDDFFTLQEYNPFLMPTDPKDDGDSDGDSDDDTPKSPKPDNDGKVPKKYNRNKIKYVCPNCKCKVWGKAGLNLHCNDCDCDFEVEE